MARSRAGSFDARAFAEAIRGPGMDTRTWCSYGTVGVIGDDGSFDTSSMEAILVAPDGVYADVRLEPSGMPVTCRVQLGIGSTGTILAPIKPGDAVLVHVASGNPAAGPVIGAILTTQEAKLPLDSARKSIFKNDRLLIQVGSNLPVEVNAKRINLGGESATQPAVLGSNWKQCTEQILDAILALTVPTAMGPSGVPINSASFQQIKSALQDKLSTRTFLKD